jgi:hypothetical protein
MPGLAADRLEWRRLLEDEWPVAEPLLRRTGRVVEQVWCPSPGGDGCPRRVVHHDNGRIVAVCGDRPRHCDPLDLTFEDLVVLGVDGPRLRTQLAVVFAVDTATGADLGHGLHRLGEHLVASGNGVAMVLLIPEAIPAKPLAVLPAVLDRTDPVVLLTPTRELLGDGVRDALKARGGLALPLIETVGADATGALAALRPAAEILGDVRERLIRKRKIKAPEYGFPTPPGARWQQVSIRFISGHDVHIQVRQEAGAYNFAQMAMANRKKKPAEPNVQWRLLADFAESGGELTWRDSAANRKLAKRRELLAKRLKTFFGIDEEPFETLPNGAGWRARFKILPET